MKTIFPLLSAIIFLTLIASCGSDSGHSQSYYYADQGLDGDKNNADTIVNLQNTETIRDFIKGKTFVSKGNKMVFDDSLIVTLYYNGVAEKPLVCEVQEYILKNERLLVMRDTSRSKVLKFTISPNGILTDINTYAMYKIKE